ncbi:MAG: helix-turn-helix domain-containing protein [Proteobacteria bacterium]|nr:helix-turn-helix domain-containing protein [Pseudomonadota bacterium]
MPEKPTTATGRAHKTPRQNPSAPVGRQIRELRRSRGITLSELAEDIGRSVGHLSELERGISPITLDTLDKIAVRLDVSISWFFSAGTLEETPESGIVVRSDRRRELNLSRAGVREELLSPHLTGGLEMILTTFAPGAETGAEGRQRKGEEGGYLMSGELELRIDGQEIHLQAGDSFQLHADGRHWCRNPGEVETQVVWVFGNAHF